MALENSLTASSTLSNTVTKKAVVLVSGGLDSATVLAIAKSKGYECYALSFDYGQRHSHELLQSKKVAQSLGAKQHKIANIDLGIFGGSALTDEAIDVPDHEEQGIPITYVPARNTVFLSMALGWAEVLNASAIYIGANAVDYSGYPDCRPEYIQAFEAMANLATKQSVEGVPFQILAPLIDLSKADIIKQGIALGVDYGITSSCYDPKPDGAPCGVCDSCRIRAAGFASAGIDDPLVS